jgi:segregation and condensation protein A
MGYEVKTDVFQGPFDLLLHLVSKQRLDVADINVSEVADQYLEHLERMRELDLDVASEFLLVAATLLEIKAARLLPEDEQPVIDEFDELSPEEARELLVTRLLAYKQFKNVAAELNARMEAEAHRHVRHAGLEERFLKLMPDFLEEVTLHQLATICAELEMRREIFLLQAEHIAARPVSVDYYMGVIEERLGRRGKGLFSELLETAEDAHAVVGLFLAILELYKYGRLEVVQEETFGDIMLAACENEGMLEDGS